jgi:hypothetical protein
MRKRSLIFSMLQPLHYLVDQLTGIFLAFLGEMEIDHGGLKLGVAHVPLDDPQVHTGFEEVRGIGVALMPCSA